MIKIHSQYFQLLLIGIINSVLGVNILRNEFFFLLLTKDLKCFFMFTNQIYSVKCYLKKEIEEKKKKKKKKDLASF